MKVYLLIFCLTYCSLTKAQSSSLNWAHSTGGNSTDLGECSKTDICGNVYTSGHFKGLVDFDPSPATFTLNAQNIINNNGDAFITKFDAAGNFIWAKQIGGSHADGDVYSLCFDPSGNIAFVAVFFDVVDIDPSPSQYTVGAANLWSTSVSRLDVNGNFISGFAIVTGDPGYTDASLKFDSAGNLLVTSSFSGTVDFDPGPGSYTLTVFGPGFYSDNFICKFSPSGNLLWAKQFGGNNNDFSLDLDIDASNNVFACGSFSGTADFDPGPGTHTLTATSSLGMNPYILKLDPSGNLLWVKQFAYISNLVECFAIALDTAGNVYSSGDFSGVVDFDPGSSVFNMTSAVAAIFITKFDPSGNFLWAKQTTGTASTSSGASFDITLDKDQSVYAAGYFTSLVDFDPGPGTYTLNSFGNEDAFLLQLDENGNFIQARQFGGVASDFAYGVSVDNAGSAYITGFFNQTADFDPGPSVSNLTSQGNFDIFICKVSLCADVPVNVHCSGQSICAGNTASLSAISNGSVSWYSSYTSSTSIASGSVFTTPTLSPGTYTYYAASSTCTANIITRAEFALTVNALPSLSLSAKPATVCAGQSAVLSASGAATYSWSTSQQSPSVSVIPTATTIYTVTGTNTLTGCQSSKTLSVAYSTCAGLKERVNESVITVYPNPATDHLNIDLKRDAELTVFDALGKIVFSTEIKKGNSVISLSDFKEGVYILQIKSDNETSMLKFIKLNSN